MIKELEKVVKNKKEDANNDPLFQKKFDFVAEEFIKNKKIINKYMEEQDITIKRAYNKLHSEIINLYTESIVQKENSSFTINDVLQMLPVRLGYREIWNPDGKQLDPEMIIQQCPVHTTKKGHELYGKYNNLSA